MKADLKKKWVEALRSGEYLQAQSYLKKSFQGQDSFCCLGVLCEILIKEGLKLDTEFDKGHYYYSNSSRYLPIAVLHFADMQDDNLRTQEVIAMNDHGQDFKEISDKIEEWPST